MSDFEDLLMPGNTNGVTPQLWFVESMTTFKYLVNEEPARLEELGKTLDPKFYFSSELAAHSAAADYYISRGKPYIYVQEFKKICDAIENDSKINAGKIESQEMQF